MRSTTSTSGGNAVVGLDSLDAQPNDVKAIAAIRITILGFMGYSSSIGIMLKRQTDISMSWAKRIEQ
jgi:hypothetical protein